MDGKPLFHSDPMGGIQIIAVGDFFQLPPVKLHGGFAFESAAWRNLNFVSCVMSRIWRQSDPTFANILNEIRLGRVSGEALRKLQECERPLPTDDGECPHCRRNHPSDSTLSPLPLLWLEENRWLTSLTLFFSRHGCYQGFFPPSCTRTETAWTVRTRNFLTHWRVL